MRRTAGSIFGLAVAASLLLHLALVGSPSAWWAALVPAEEVAFPINASLAATPLPVPTPVASPVAPPPRVVEEAPPLPAATPPEPTPSLPPPVAVAAPASLPLQAPSPATALPPAVPVRADAPPLRVPPVLRPLPEQMTLTYAVAMGEGGFKAGRNVYQWHREGSRYSLKSRAEASGLLSFFMTGNIMQESRGEIGPEGLRPEQFQIQRGERRSDQARFDRAGQQLLLNGETQALRPLTQDLLSFLLHLGMTLQPEQLPFILPVTDGRKLRGYRVSAPVAETQGARALWRLHAWRDGDGEVDLWFDLERGALPVRIRVQDSKGQVMTQSLEAD